ncbi:PspC domain-containing protein [Georgenia sp. MJ206]|uniref:PspC domain-containing protein n=1 Tax=Georgenia wangjunii TaxID=3117730 RepID=UPI002F264420
MDTTPHHDPPAAPAPPPPRPSGGDSFFDSLRRTGIWRTDDRWVGGVAAGTAQRLGIDPALVRGLLVVLTFFGGLGLILYGAGWALLPEARDGRIHLQQAMRGHVDAALAGAIAVFIIGISRPVFWWDFPGNGWGAVWVLVLIGLTVAAVVSARGARTTPPTHPHDPTTPYGAAAWTAPPAPAAWTTPPPAPTAGEIYPMTTYPAAPAGPAPDADAPTRAFDNPLHDAPPSDVPTPGDGSSAYGGPGYEPPTTPFFHDGGAPPPVVPPVPPVPPRPPVPGPSSTTVSIVLALCLLTTAALLLAHRAGALDGNPVLVVGGTVLALLGLGVVLSGMRGRRQGALGGLALVLAIVLVPTASAVAVLPGLGTVGGLSSPGSALAGDPTFRPTTGPQASEGYELGAGELTVDLTELGTARGTVEVPVEVAFGVARVLVPEDGDIEVRASVAGGEIIGRLGADWSVPSGALPGDATRGGDSLGNGMGVEVVVVQEGTGAATGPDIIVEVEVGFGQVIIEERS